MKVYFIKDLVSGNVINVELSENLESYKRHLINTYLSFKEKSNFTGIRLLKDCVVYEAEIAYNSIEFNLVGVSVIADRGIGLAKVLVLKDFFNEFGSKKGSNLDKSE